MKLSVNSPRWIVAACALLAGCTQSILTAPLPVLDPGHAAVVVIIRPSVFMRCGEEVPVMLDGRTIFIIDCGKHVLYPVAAGDHVLAVGRQNWLGVPTVTTTPVTVMARERLYLRLDPNPMTLKPIPPEEGERLMTDTLNFLSPAR